MPVGYFGAAGDEELKEVASFMLYPDRNEQICHLLKNTVLVSIL